MKKEHNRKVKFLYPMWQISPINKKRMGSVLINGELTIGTLNAQVKSASTGSTLVFEVPTGMAHVRKWGNRSFELDSVLYINDVKTTRGPVFWYSSRALLFATKNSKYLSGQIESS